MGLHIRVGTEDTVWRYPFGDEKLKSNVQAFQTAKTICELLGREIADAEDQRQLFGIR